MIEQGGRGGVADYTAELTRALSAAGWCVSLATAEDHRYRAIAGARIHRIFHYVRGSSRLARRVRRARLGPLANGLRFLASLPRLVALARRADVVHSQGWEYAPLGVVAIACLRLAGVPIVQTAHNTFERGRRTEGARNALLALTARTIVHAERRPVTHPAARAPAREGHPARRVWRTCASRRRSRPGRRPRGSRTRPRRSGHTAVRSAAP